MHAVARWIRKCLKLLSKIKWDFNSSITNNDNFIWIDIFSLRKCKSSIAFRWSVAIVRLKSEKLTQQSASKDRENIRLVSKMLVEFMSLLLHRCKMTRQWTRNSCFDSIDCCNYVGADISSVQFDRTASGNFKLCRMCTKLLAERLNIWFMDFVFGPLFRFWKWFHCRAFIASNLADSCKHIRIWILQFSTFDTLSQFTKYDDEIFNWNMWSY